MIIYDCEIIKAIPPRRGNMVEGVEYCKGWGDFKNMGISVICVYDYAQDRARVFLQDNFDEFQALVNDASLVIGYNSLSFDNKLCAANGIDVPEEKSWDVLVDIWQGAGLGPRFQYPSHAGYGLDAVSKANGFGGKTGYGGTAPVDWQQGRYGKVIDYCLQDIALTKRIFDSGTIIDPKTGKTINLHNQVHGHAGIHQETADTGQETP